MFSETVFDYYRLVGAFSIFDKKKKPIESSQFENLQQ